MIKKLIKEKKEKAPRKIRSKKLAIQSLQDAVINGKWTVAVGQDFLVLKTVSGKQIQTICTFKEMINESTVDSWDKSLEHWYAFNIDDLEKYNIIVKKV